MEGTSFTEYTVIATLAGLLAGFSLAGVIELLEFAQEKKLATVSIIVFSIASLTFMYSLFTFVTLSLASLVPETDFSKLDPIAASAFVVSVLGILLFLAGIALVGWLRSRITGIITTIGVLVTSCALLSTLVAIIMAVPPAP